MDDLGAKGTRYRAFASDAARRRSKNPENDPMRSRPPAAGA